MKKITQETLVWIILSVIGAFFLYQSFTFRGNAGQFPQIILIIFIVLLALLLFSEFIKKEETSKEDKKIKFSEIKNPLIIFFFCIIYVLGLEYIGFIWATLLFIPGVMFYYNNKQKFLYIFCTIGTIGFMYTLFNVILKLQLP